MRERSTCGKVCFLERIAVSPPGCAISAAVFDGTTGWLAVRGCPTLVHVFADVHVGHVTHALYFPEDITFLEWGVSNNTGTAARLFLLAVSVAQRAWLFEFFPGAGANAGRPNPGNVPSSHPPEVWVEGKRWRNPGRGEETSEQQSKPLAQDGISVSWELFPLQVPEEPKVPNGVHTYMVDPTKGTWLIIPACGGLDSPTTGACLVSQVVWEYLTSLPHPLPNLTAAAGPASCAGPVLHDLSLLACLLGADLDAEGLGPLLYIRRWLAQTPCQLSARCAIHLSPSTHTDTPTAEPGGLVRSSRHLPADGGANPSWQGCTSRVTAQLPLVQSLLAQGHLSCGDAGCLVFGDAQGKVWGVPLGLPPSLIAPSATSGTPATKETRNGGPFDCTGEGAGSSGSSQRGNGWLFCDAGAPDLSRVYGDEHRVLLFDLEEPIVAILPVREIEGGGRGDHFPAVALVIVGQQGHMLHVSAVMGPQRGGLRGTGQRHVITAGLGTGPKVDSPELRIVEAHLHPWITAAQVVSGSLFYAAQGHLYMAHLPQKGVPDQGEAQGGQALVHTVMLDALVDTVLLVSAQGQESAELLLVSLDGDVVKLALPEDGDCTALHKPQTISATHKEIQGVVRAIEEVTARGDPIEAKMKPLDTSLAELAVSLPLAHTIRHETGVQCSLSSVALAQNALSVGYGGLIITVTLLVTGPHHVTPAWHLVVAYISPAQGESQKCCTSCPLGGLAVGSRVSKALHLPVEWAGPEAVLRVFLCHSQEDSEHPCLALLLETRLDVLHLLRPRQKIGGRDENLLHSLVSSLVLCGPRAAWLTPQALLAAILTQDLDPAPSATGGVTEVATSHVDGSIPLGADTLPISLRITLLEEHEEGPAPYITYDIHASASSYSALAAVHLALQSRLARLQEVGDNGAQRAIRGQGVQMVAERCAAAKDGRLMVAQQRLETALEDLRELSRMSAALKDTVAGVARLRQLSEGDSLAFKALLGQANLLRQGVQHGYQRLRAVTGSLPCLVQGAEASCPDTFQPGGQVAGGLPVSSLDCIENTGGNANLI